MVLWLLFAVLAGFDSSSYRSLESLPLLITEKCLELTSRPVLLIVLIGMTDRVKKRESNILVVTNLRTLILGIQDEP